MIFFRNSFAFLLLKGMSIVWSPGPGVGPGVGEMVGVGEGVGVARGAGLRADERRHGLGWRRGRVAPSATRHQQASEGQGCRHLEDHTTNFT